MKRNAEIPVDLDDDLNLAHEYFFYAGRLRQRLATFREAVTQETVDLFDAKMIEAGDLLRQRDVAALPLVREAYLLLRDPEMKHSNIPLDSDLARSLLSKLERGV